MYGFFLPVFNSIMIMHDHYQYQYHYYILKTTETKDHIGKFCVEVIIFFVIISIFGYGSDIRCHSGKQ